jgi:hypothetical protein
MKRAIFAAAGALLLTAAPAFAHHPFSAEFDANAPVHINGKVSRIDWGNPHVMIQVVATNGNQNWTLEAASPTELAKKGWSRDTVKIGDQIAVDAYKAKSEPNTASARTIELPGGKKLSAADDEDGGPKASLSP